MAASTPSAWVVVAGHGGNWMVAIDFWLHLDGQFSFLVASGWLLLILGGILIIVDP